MIVGVITLVVSQPVKKDSHFFYSRHFVPRPESFDFRSVLEWSPDDSNITPDHSYYKEMVMKPGKLQRNKQISQDLCWKVHDPAQSFVLRSRTWAELRNRHVSMG